MTAYTATHLDRLEELSDSRAPFRPVRHDLACCESLAGRHADALEHLANAVAGSGDLRELAKGDADLNAIRDDPRFAEVVRA